MKFLQIHVFYDQYLHDFYAVRPTLASQPFAEQIETIMDDGFSDGHILPRHLVRLGYDARFIVANCAPAQAKWLAENNVTDADTNNWVLNVPRRQIEAFKPDILFLSHPIGFDDRFIDSLSWKPKLIVGWRAAPIPAGTSWSRFDLIVSSSTKCLEWARQLGAKATEYHIPGFSPEIARRCADQQQEWDVVFSGQWSDLHANRNSLLMDVARAPLTGRREFSTAFFLPNDPATLPAGIAMHHKGARWGIDMFRALKSGRITLNAGIDMAEGEAPNMRLFEATGVGAFLLTERQQKIEQFFVPGREIETFTGSAELLEKINFYLDHPLERVQIAAQGQARCLRDYSMEKRAEAFDALIRRYLGATVSTPSLTATDVLALREQSIELLSANETDRAFDLLIEAKRAKEPLRNIDLLRAVCFMRMNQPGAAKQALLEEMRFFPDNAEAKKSLGQFETAAPAGTVVPNDEEFSQLLSLIRPYSMLGELRLYSLFCLAKQVCELDLPGNFVECGVAAGGSSALLAYVIKAYSKRSRFLFSFDSFSGMPVPGEHDVEVCRGLAAEDTGWGTGTCAAPVDSLLEISKKLGVISIVRPVKGYYEETLHKFRKYIGEIAFIHIDSDWYESTRAILDNFYDQLHPQAAIQFDDYGYWKGCGKALHEFEAARGLSFTINQIDGNGVWFRKA